MEDLQELLNKCNKKCTPHSAAGNPEPILTWEYKSAKSSDFTVLHNTTNDDDLKLTINNVTADDAGAYRCVAENVVGRDEFQIQLVVHCKSLFLLSGLYVNI